MNLRSEKPEIIGEGKEKVVYIDPENPDKVIAEFDRGETERLLKGRFYLSKILHLLFPQNIPDIHLAVKSGNSFIVLERKKLDELHRKLQDLRLISYSLDEYRDKGKIQALKKELDAVYTEHAQKVGSDERFGYFLEKTNALGLKIDTVPINFGYDEKGNLMYVDNNFTPWQLQLYISGPKIEYLFSKERILHAIGSLRGGDKEKAMTYLSRLEKIAEEERSAAENNDVYKRDAGSTQEIN